LRIIYKNIVEVYTGDAGLASDGGFEAGFDIDFVKWLDSLKKQSEFLNRFKKQVQEIIDQVELWLKYPARELESLLKTVDDDAKHDSRDLILRYLVRGKYYTRLGDLIERPKIEKSADIVDNYFQITLDISRIYYEGIFDKGSDLDYLGEEKDDESEEIKHRRKMEKQVGDFADGLGSMTGLYIATAFKGVLGDRLEDAQKIAPFFTGLYARKVAELSMHKHLT
jgi:hypothetical protein